MIKLTLAAWQRWVRTKYPAVQFTVEDGTGKTYGDVGDCAAHIGPDMQADVVGTWSAGEQGCCWLWCANTRTETYYDVSRET